MYRYLIGDPDNGPFTGPLTATDEAAARAEVTREWGAVLDVVDWTDDHGQPIDLYIVRG